MSKCTTYPMKLKLINVSFGNGNNYHPKWLAISHYDIKYNIFVMYC